MRKNVLLVENRPKQMVVTSLNLNVYLDSQVQIINTFEEFSLFIESDNLPIDLIISRDNFNDSNISVEINKELESKNKNIPHLVIGKEEGQTLLDDKFIIRPMLKESAKLLKLTPQMMAEIKIGDFYEVTSNLVHFLNFAPCDIFKLEESGNYKKVYTRREVIKPEFKIDLSLVTSIYIQALERLEFVNSLTEQNRESFLDSDAVEGRFRKEVETINDDMAIVCSQIKSGGDKDEIIKIAGKSIESMVSLAEESIVVKDLISRLNDSDANFRFRHSQLIIFIGLQALKKLGCSEEDMQSFSNAAFYHDICLKEDDVAAVRDNRSILMNDFSSEELDNIRNHAFDVHNLVKDLKNVDEKTLRILKEHHGNQDGLGFGDSLKGLSYLSKAFVITEHWVHLMMFQKTEELEDLSKYIKLFKKSYPGEKEEEFIKTLFIIEGHELVKNLTEDIAEEIFTIKGTYHLDESIALFKGDADKEDESTTLSGMTETIKDEAQLVKGSADKEVEGSTTIKGSIEDIKEEVTLIKGGEEDNSPDTMMVKSLADSNENPNPQINSENLISVYITRSKDLTEEVGGVWAKVKFLSALMSLDNPLKKHPFIDDFNKIGLDLKESMEKQVVLESFTSQIIDLEKNVQEKFEEEIVNTINNKDKSGRTKIMIAISATNLEMFNYMLGFNPDLKLTDNTGKTTLHYAVLSENIEIVQKVLDANPTALNKTDSKKRSSLFLAVTSNNEEIVSHILKLGSQPRILAENGVSSCMIACRNGNLDMVKQLVAHGEILSAVDFKHKGCMAYARQKKQKEVMLYLKEQDIS